MDSSPDAFSEFAPRIARDPPTAPAAPRFPHCDPHRQPCRALLTEIMVWQSDWPGKTPAAKTEIERARKRLLAGRRDPVADEKSCWDSLKRIGRVVIDRFDGPVHFETEEARSLWERLLSLMPDEPMNGVLADLEN